MALKPYRVGKVTVRLTDPKPGRPDTLRLRGAEVIAQRPMRIRPRLLSWALTLERGELFTVGAQDRTLTNLNKLGVFRSVSLNVAPVDSLRGSDTLDVGIDARFDYPLEAALETDVTSKSNSFLGPGIALKVSNNNLFRGGEVLSVALNGSYEWQTGNKRSGGRSSQLNSYELGLNATLNVPRLLVPQSMLRRQRYPGSTSFQLGADLMNRPDFFRLVAFSGSMGYNFQTSPYSRHALTLFKLTYNKLLHTTEEFDRTMDENPAIAMSFRNQFVPSIGYTYTFDRTYGAAGNRRLVWQNSFTSAGNLLAGVLRAFGEKQPQELFGNRFSQFVKEVSELKFYHRIGRRNNWLAARLLIGVGYAYGSSEVMPYSEQFYIGGANSIRAFTIRSIGPGSYRPPAGDRNGYLDQTGDFKLEANVEYRFAILGKLGGAVFLDAGNVWLLKKDPKRPGAELKWKGLLDEIALGTGFGLRYDISYLVIRADLGIGCIRPVRIPTSGGITTCPASATGWVSIWPSAIPSDSAIRHVMKNNLLTEQLVYNGESRTKTHIHLIRYSPSGFEESLCDDFAAAVTAAAPSDKLWVRVHGLEDAACIQEVCTRFGVDFLVVQDILNVEHPSKVEVYDDFNFVVSSVFVGERVVRVRLVQGPNVVLSFTEGGVVVLRRRGGGSAAERAEDTFPFVGLSLFGDDKRADGELYFGGHVDRRRSGGSGVRADRGGRRPRHRRPAADTPPPVYGPQARRAAAPGPVHQTAAFGRRTDPCGQPSLFQ